MNVGAQDVAFTPPLSGKTYAASYQEAFTYTLKGIFCDLANLLLSLYFLIIKSIVNYAISKFYRDN